MLDETKTGKTRFRIGMFGKVILQVEVRLPAEPPGHLERVWRDATAEDITETDHVEASRLEKGCCRSHPHENMNEECNRKTEMARQTNQAARKSWRGCHVCFGSGGKKNHPCKNCNGTGRVPR